jgi:hypothetical protein
MQILISVLACRGWTGSVCILTATVDVVSGLAAECNVYTMSVLLAYRVMAVVL